MLAFMAVLFVALLLVSTPIAIILLTVTGATLHFFLHIPLQALVQQLFNGMDNFYSAGHSVLHPGRQHHGPGIDFKTPGGLHATDCGSDSRRHGRGLHSGLHLLCSDFRLQPGHGDRHRLDYDSGPYQARL